MKSSIILPLIVAAALFVPVTSAFAGDQPAEGAGAARTESLAADREARFDARLGGMKAGLKLTSDQEKLWDPFETAVRDVAKAQLENARRMRESQERMSPVDRMEAMAGNLIQNAAQLQAIAKACKPMYASLDDRQKRAFALLGRELLMTPRRDIGGDAGFSWEPENWGN